MLVKSKFNYFFNFDVKFFYKVNKFYIKGNIGSILFTLPSFFFIRNKEADFSFCFLDKQSFIMVYKQLSFYLKFFYKLFFIRLRLKGLGYRIKKYDKGLYRFFMGYNHYFYFYTPVNIFIWNKKRNLLLISMDKVKINDVFNQLLLLKKMDFFEKTNSFISPKKILFLKK